MFAAQPGTGRHTAVVSAVASLVGIATATATVLAYYQTIAVLDIAALAAAALLAALVCLWQTRHAMLAILAATAPLPGLVWAAPLSGGSQFGVVPFLSYGFGVVVAALYAQQVLDRLLNHGENESPWRAAAVTVGLLAVLAALWFWHGEGADAALQASADTLAVVLSVLLLWPLAASHITFDEDFVADANRARERRALRFDKLGNGAIPRWGLALTGIALIFLALGWFDAEPMLRQGWWRPAVSVVLVCGALGTFARGWREGLGLGLITAVAGLAALWWRIYDGRAPFGAVSALQIAILAAFIGLCAARHMRIWRREGDPPEMARRRALEDSSGAVIATLAATAAMLPVLLLHAGATVFVLATLAAGLLGALLFPAVLTGLETLLPRRQSVDEVFSKMRKR